MLIFIDKLGWFLFCVDLKIMDLDREVGDRFGHRGHWSSCTAHFFDKVGTADLAFGWSSESIIHSIALASVTYHTYR